MFDPRVPISQSLPKTLFCGIRTRSLERSFDISVAFLIIASNYESKTDKANNVTIIINLFFNGKKKCFMIFLLKEILWINQYISYTNILSKINYILIIKAVYKSKTIDLIWIRIFYTICCFYQKFYSITWISEITEKI